MCEMIFLLNSAYRLVCTAQVYGRQAEELTKIDRGCKIRLTIVQYSIVRFKTHKSHKGDVRNLTTQSSLYSWFGKSCFTELLCSICTRGYPFRKPLIPVGAKTKSHIPMKLCVNNLRCSLSQNILSHTKLP